MIEEIYTLKNVPDVKLLETAQKFLFATNKYGQEIPRQIKSDGEKAFNELFSRYRQDLIDVFNKVFPNVETGTDANSYCNDAITQAALNANAFKPELSRDGKAFFWIWGIMRYCCLRDLIKQHKFSRVLVRLTDECYKKLGKSTVEYPSFEANLDDKLVGISPKIKTWRNEVKNNLRSKNTISLLDFIFQKFTENDFESDNYIKEIKMKAISELKIDPGNFDLTWSRIKKIFRKKGLK